MSFNRSYNGMNSQPRSPYAQTQRNQAYSLQRTTSFGNANTQRNPISSQSPKWGAARPVNRYTPLRSMGQQPQNSWNQNFGSASMTNVGGRNFPQYQYQPPQMGYQTPSGKADPTPQQMYQQQMQKQMKMQQQQQMQQQQMQPQQHVQLQQQMQPQQQMQQASPHQQNISTDKVPKGDNVKYVQMKWEDILGGKDRMKLMMSPPSGDGNRQVRIAVGNNQQNASQAPGEVPLKVVSFDPVKDWSGEKGIVVKGEFNYENGAIEDTPSSQDPLSYGGRRMSMINGGNKGDQRAMQSSSASAYYNPQQYQQKQQQPNYGMMSQQMMNSAGGESMNGMHKLPPIVIGRDQLSPENVIGTKTINGMQVQMMKPIHIPYSAFQGQQGQNFGFGN